MAYRSIILCVSCALKYLDVMYNCHMLLLLFLVLSPGLQCMHLFYDLGKLHSWGYTELSTV